MSANFMCFVCSRMVCVCDVCVRVCGGGGLGGQGHKFPFVNGK